MNRYLEKIAAIDPVKAWVRGGALVGATLGGYSGSHKTKKVLVSPWRTKEVELTTPERIFHSVAGATTGAIGGIMAGSIIANHRHPEQFKAHYREAYKKQYQGNGGARGSYASRTIHDIHGDLGMPKGGFKTKTEATTHFRKMRSKHHPDRAKTDADRVSKNAQMAKLNKAWDEFNKHPEVFTKLANAYLEKIAGLDVGKVKSIIKSHPLSVLFGTLGATDGAISTEKRSKDSELRYRLRQLRKTVGYGAAGVGAGYVLQRYINQISN